MLAMAGITGRPGTEDDQPKAVPGPTRRTTRVGLGEQGVRSSVVRLAPMVHSELDHHGFTHTLIGFARRERRSRPTAATVPTGGRRPTHYDIGVLYRLALEKAPAGSTLHGVG